MDDTLNARIRRLMDDASTLADESKHIVQQHRRRRVVSPRLTRPTMRPIQATERVALSNKTG